MRRFLIDWVRNDPSHVALAAIQVSTMYQLGPAS
jgi:hypothetical protein